MAFKNRNPNHGRQTVRWSSHRSSRYNQECADKQIGLLDDALKTLSGVQLPSSPFIAPWHNGCTTINDVEKFIEGHKSRVLGLKGFRRLAGPYLRRLIQLKEFAVNNWPLKDDSTPVHLTPDHPSKSFSDSERVVTG